MKIRFTIGKKIGTGFGILIFLTLIVFVATYLTLQESKRINDEINTVNVPSVKVLQELKYDILESRLYLETWRTEFKAHGDKQRLLDFRSEGYPQIKKRIEDISVNWDKAQQDSLVHLFETIELLFYQQSIDVIDMLQTFEDYEENPFAILNAHTSIEEGGDIYILTSKVTDQLDNLINTQKEIAEADTVDIFNSFRNLEILVKYLGMALIIIGIAIAIYTTKTIVEPIKRLKKVAVKLGKGVFPSRKMDEGQDEIGEMTAAMNNVVTGMRRTKDFANAVGAGNFDKDYDPLSSKDSLGHALLKMRDDLAENERILEEKVRQRTAEVVAQKEEIEEQRTQIEEYFVQVTDSIKYAKRIQEAILPPDGYVQKLLPDSFILYRPKDIVSGDFYWMAETADKVFFAAVDCTGHGVPGAFMSIVGYNQLKQAIATTAGSSPADILNQLNRGVTETLRQSDVDSTSRDGMDIAICALNKNSKELEYAGAFNPLYLLREGELIQYKADKFPIGSYLDNKKKTFTNNKIKLKKGDQVYIFSDGYADQFGGPRGKKFMYRRFRELLIENEHEKPSQQKNKLLDSLYNWMRDEEQVDDILVMGVRV
ncbi:MAG: hypothetical protein CMP59_12375 [Flavobacteriales bacterium]|nr:hypothetical protein [Flavobacteriales bacterium]